MASKYRHKLIPLVLVLLSLAIVSYLSEIGAELGESRDHRDLEMVEDGGIAEDTDEYMDDGESEVEDNVEDEGEDENEEDEGGEEGQDREKEMFDEGDVVVLGSNNFTNYVTKERYVFVEFYAPWCRHCQKLAPEWAATATALRGQVSIAKVDAIAHRDVSENLNVISYPMLFFFIDGTHRSYYGNRSKDAFVNYVNKKMSLTVRALMSISDAEPLMEVKSPIAIAYLKKLKGPEVFELTIVARQEDDVDFYMTSNGDVAAMFGLETKIKPVLVLLKNVPERRVVCKDIFKRKPLYNFVSTNKLPLVIFYTYETTSLIFESSLSKQILCFVRDEEYWGYAQPLFVEVARAFKGQALFIRVSLENSEGLKAAEYFGVTGENPIVIMGFVRSEDGPKYLYEGEFTIPGIKNFVYGFMKDKVKRHYKSEVISGPNNQDVKIAVGRNFEEMVLDEAKDTLLQLYTPWCNHCQELEPIYKKLAKRLKGIPSLSIVKMDAAANEHPRAKADSFPTILLFPAGKKSLEPIRFEGDRTIKGFYQFLKKNAAIPFALPNTANSRASNKVQTLKDEL